MTRIGLILAVALVSAVAGCSPKTHEGAPPSPTDGPRANLDKFWLTDAPKDAVSVLEAKKAVKSGDSVHIAGRIKDWVGGFAAFTMIDSTLKACSDPGDAMGDACKTPWDYCCIGPDEQRAASVTVEFRDGKDPISGVIAGFHGFDHLKHVVVVGKAEVDGSGNVTVVADGIHVKAQ